MYISVTCYASNLNLNIFAREKCVWRRKKKNPDLFLRKHRVRVISTSRMRITESLYNILYLMYSALCLQNARCQGRRGNITRTKSHTASERNGRWKTPKEWNNASSTDGKSARSGFMKFRWHVTTKLLSIIRPSIM